MWDLNSWLGLGEERHNGLAGVATDDWNHGLGWVLGAGNALHEGLGTDDIERGHTEDMGGVVDTGLLEHGGHNGHGRVDGVGDDEDLGLGRNARNCGRKVADDGRVGLVNMSGHVHGS